MALLLDPDRATVHAQWMRVNTLPLGAVSKTELRDAVNAIDQWIDDNAAAFNAAIPQPARGALTARQKVWLFVAVLQRRFEVS